MGRKPPNPPRHTPSVKVVRRWQVSRLAELRVSPRSAPFPVSQWVRLTSPVTVAGAAAPK